MAKTLYIISVTGTVVYCTFIILKNYSVSQMLRLDPNSQKYKKIFTEIIEALLILGSDSKELEEWAAKAKEENTESKL